MCHGRVPPVTGSALCDPCEIPLYETDTCIVKEVKYWPFHMIHPTSTLLPRPGWQKCRPEQGGAAPEADLLWSGRRQGFLWLPQSLGGQGPGCPAGPRTAEAPR